MKVYQDLSGIESGVIRNCQEIAVIGREGEHHPVTSSHQCTMYHTQNGQLKFFRENGNCKPLGNSNNMMGDCKDFVYNCYIVTVALKAVTKCSGSFWFWLTDHLGDSVTNNVTF